MVILKMMDPEGIILIVLFVVASISLLLLLKRLVYLIMLQYKRSVVPVVSNTTEYSLPPMCVGWLLRQPNPKTKQLAWLPVLQGDDPSDVWEVLETLEPGKGRIVLPWGEHPLGHKL